jgi:hypothetical protein
MKQDAFVRYRKKFVARLPSEPVGRLLRLRLAYPKPASLRLKLNSFQRLLALPRLSPYLFRFRFNPRALTRMNFRKNCVSSKS